MINIIVLWISPLLHENVALRMGNLQVTKNRCSRVRTSLSWVIIFMIFHEYVVGLLLWGFYDEACVPRLLCYWIYSPAKFWIIAMTNLRRNKLLFIHIWDFLRDVTFCYVKTLIYLRNYYVGKTGCYRSNRRCELIPRVVIGVMLWYVTGWGYLYVLFSLLRITF